ERQELRSNPARCGATVNLSRFCQSGADREPRELTDREPETRTNSRDDLDLESWLGGRDSNPDNVVQRTEDGVSCAPLRAFLQRSSRQHLRQLPSVSLRSCAACLIVSQAGSLSGYAFNRAFGD